MNITGMMSRRKFLAVGSAAMLLSIVGVFLLDFKKTVRKFLTEDVSQLNIDQKSIDQFMQDAERERYWDQFGLGKRIFIPAQHLLMQLGIRTLYHEKYVQYRNKITGQFLFSTDLFQVADGQKVSYVEFHNPYKAPCSMPFSALRVSA